MAITSHQDEESLLAKLAIQLGRKTNTATGAVPSNEELAAFADQSLIDPTRRSQIMSHIASNSEVYQRWITVVEAVSRLETAVTAATASVSSREAKAGLFSRLGAWLFGSNVRAGVFGGGMATAAIVIMAIILVPILGKLVSLDQQYDDLIPVIEGQWGSVPHGKKDIHDGSDSRAFQFLTEAQSVVEYGFHKNAETLGEQRYAALGITLNKDIKAPAQPEGVNKDQYQKLQQLGKLVALTTLQCELPLDSKAYDKSYKVAENIMKKISSVNDEALQALNNNLKTKDHKAALCGLSDQVLKIIF